MSTVTAGASAHRTGWTIAEGILLVVAGLMAIGAPLTTAAITAWALPFVLLVEGVVLLVAGFSDTTVGSRGWSIAFGVLAIIAAIAVFGQPYVTLASLPIIVGIYLIAKGGIQFAVGANATEGKGWLYTAAVINILFAILLFAQPFGASLFLTGLYLGFSILFFGIVLLMLPKAEASRESMV